MHETHIMQPNPSPTCDGGSESCAKCAACTCHFPNALSKPCTLS